MRTVTQSIIKFLDGLSKFFDKLFFNDVIKVINSYGTENIILVVLPIIAYWLINSIIPPYNPVPKIFILLISGHLYAKLLQKRTNSSIKWFALVPLLFGMDLIGGDDTEICMKLLPLLSAFMWKWNYDNFIKKNRRSISLICVIAIAIFGSYNVNSVFVIHAFLTITVSSFEFTFLSLIVYTVVQRLIVVSDNTITEDLHKIKLTESNTHIQTLNVSN